MKTKIITLATHLLYKYQLLLNEIIAQKLLFPSNTEFINAWCKYGAIVNKLQGTILNYTL